MRKTVGIDEIIATYSSHINNSYPYPRGFREMLDNLLAGKRERQSGEDYAVALEMNVVFLRDLIVEAEALIDTLLRSGTGDHPVWDSLDETLKRMEEGVRVNTDEARLELFEGGTDDEFRELRKLRRTGGTGYVGKLKSTYRYLMALRILMFEFVNVLASIRSGYDLPRPDAGDAAIIRNHIELTANYYLGGIEVDGTGGQL